jgi:hypothetical protein
MVVTGNGFFCFASSCPDVGDYLPPVSGPLLWEDGGDAQIDGRLQIEPYWATDSH